MKTNKVHITLTVLALFLLIGASQSYAWQVNQHYKNLTGQTAYDVTKIFFGSVNCTEAMMGQPFNSFEATQFGPFSLFHWWNGQVAPNDYGHVCFSTDKSFVPPRLTLWSDANGLFTGLAGPVPNLAMVVQRVKADAVQIQIQIGNEWHYWTGAGYPPQAGDTIGSYVGSFTIGDVKVAYGKEKRPLKDLDSTLLYDPELTWIDLPGLNGTVIQGETSDTTINAQIEPNSFVFLYFTLEGAGVQAYDVVAYAYTGKPIPALTNWGLIILISLLLLSTVYILFRRRRQTA